MSATPETPEPKLREDWVRWLNPDIQCERGHSDGDLFPGRIREWGEGR